jgi:hypothetical protein
MSCGKNVLLSREKKSFVGRSIVLTLVIFNFVLRYMAAACLHPNPTPTQVASGARSIARAARAMQRAVTRVSAARAAARKRLGGGPGALDSRSGSATSATFGRTASATPSASAVTGYHVYNIAPRFDEPAPGTRVRFGAHTGPVVGGVIGRVRMCFDIWGDTVNVAARLEAASEPGRLLVSPALHALMETGNAPPTAAVATSAALTSAALSSAALTSAASTSAARPTTTDFPARHEFDWETRQVSLKGKGEMTARIARL